MKRERGEKSEEKREKRRGERRGKKEERETRQEKRRVLCYRKTERNKSGMRSPTRTYSVQ